MKTKHTSHDSADQSAVLNTPLPWSLSNDALRLDIVGNGEQWVACAMSVRHASGAPLNEEAKANAALIVRAVNRDHAFEALLTAGKELLDTCEHKGLYNHAHCAALRAAIAAAQPFTH